MTDEPGKHAAPGPSGRSGTSGRRAGRRGGLLDVAVVVLVALLIAALVRSFLLGVYFIPSGSMENTLLVHDRVVVDKVVYRFKDIGRGDVVVFDGEGSFSPEGIAAEPPENPVARAWYRLRSAVGAAPSHEEDFIKRVVGIPGDRVACCDDQGRLTVNGVPLDEPYVFPGDVPSAVEFDIEVPPGRLWVMGDHRGASADSRSHLGDPGGGTVPVDQVIGRARAVIWPLSRLGLLSTPDTFAQEHLSRS